MLLPGKSLYLVSNRGRKGGGRHQACIVLIFTVPFTQFDTLHSHTCVKKTNLFVIVINQTLSVLLHGNNAQVSLHSVMCEGVVLMVITRCNSSLLIRVSDSGSVRTTKQAKRVTPTFLRLPHCDSHLQSTFPCCGEWDSVTALVGGGTTLYCSRRRGDYFVILFVCWGSGRHAF